jgi:hypothetical protein
MGIDATGDDHGIIVRGALVRIDKVQRHFNGGCLSVCISIVQELKIEKNPGEVCHELLQMRRGIKLGISVALGFAAFFVGMFALSAKNDQHNYILASHLKIATIVIVLIAVVVGAFKVRTPKFADLSGGQVKSICKSVLNQFAIQNNHVYGWPQVQPAAVGMEVVDGKHAVFPADELENILKDFVKMDERRYWRKGYDPKSPIFVPV